MGAGAHQSLDGDRPRLNPARLAPGGDRGCLAAGRCVMAFPDRAAPDPTRPLAPPARSRPEGELRRARAVAHLLDDLIPIPGTGWRVGIDPLLGLIPGVGDWVGWAASLHLVVAGARAGADPATLVRMAGNLVLDAVVGVVPVAGDLFDARWKANSRNLRLLERLLADPVRLRRSSRWVVGAVLGATFALLALASLGALLVLRGVITAVTGVL